MDSDESRDNSSASDSECENKGPRSPSSVQSAESPRSAARSPNGVWEDSQSPPRPRGPHSPDTYGPRSPSPEQFGPRSPSPEGSVNSAPSPKRETPVDNPYHSPAKSPSSVHSAASSVREEEEYTRVSERSNNASPKSSSSAASSVKSRASRSPVSPKSPTGSVERRGPKSPPPKEEDDDNSSDSSDSSPDSSSRQVKPTQRLDAQAEEISDGEMEYEGGKDTDDERKEKASDVKINLSHEDLSDVSDLDSLVPSDEDEDDAASTKQEELVTKPLPPTDLRQKIDEAKSRKLSERQSHPPEKTSKTEDGEEQLDFEAEDGECVEEAEARAEAGEIGEAGEDATAPAAAAPTPEEVEEGEVTDDDEVRPEETEPRPVCRFYSRGQCTWGASCRFLHPGVTDKGNYTMFELIRPLVAGPGYGVPPDYREERPGFTAPPGRGDTPMVESAWERGLRTAKEMMRKAIKRKEQDMDFEEKKMNLTLAQDELDKENGYYTRSASPPPIDPLPRHYVMRHPTDYRQPPAARVPEDYYTRRVLYEAEAPRTVRIEPPEYEVPRERVRSYRELPTHRMPDYYNDKYEEAPPAVTGKPRRPKREVIVQRVDAGRGDEWADPWMRSKSPGGSRTKTSRYGPSRRASYSSASSYSSSSSSRSSAMSSKSSYRGASRSRSHSPSTRVRRRAKSPAAYSKVPGGSSHRAVSPSVIVSEKKAANERALLMNPPAPSSKKAHKDTRPPSPGMMRTSAQNPPAPPKTLSTDQYGRTKDRGKHDADRKKLVVAAALASKINRARASRSTSGSDSTGSSSSDSESSYSSSSSSRDGSPAVPRRKVPDKVDLAMALKVKAIDALKTGAGKGQIKLNLKSQLPKKPGLADLAELRSKTEKIESLAGKKRMASSPPGDSMPAKLAAAAAKAANNKKSTSRREELLKQLKAVEDAIAKKRSKIN